VSDELFSGLVMGDVDGDGVPDAVAGLISGRLLGLSGRSGATLFEISPGGPARCAPVLFDVDRDGLVDVVAGSRSGRVRAFSGRTGRPLWEATANDEVYVLAVQRLADGLAVVLAVSGDKHIHGFAGPDGRRLLSIDVSAPAYAAPMLCPDGAAADGGNRGWSDLARLSPGEPAASRRLDLLAVHLGSTLVRSPFSWPSRPIGEPEPWSFTGSRRLVR
jgi:hypothetical protein